MDLTNFYKHIKICLNEVNRLQEDLLTSQQSKKLHSKFHKYLISYRSPPSCYCNAHIYTYLVHSLLLAFTNDTCIKYSMVLQSYKFITTHDHEISVCNILSILLQELPPCIEGINIYFQFELATLAFKQGEKLESFYIRILIPQKKVKISRWGLYPTIILFQYMQALSNSFKIKSFIVPNITYLITFPDKNLKSYVYTEGNIHGLYCYLYIIGDPNNLTR